MVNNILIFVLIISLVNISLFFLVPDSSIFTLDISKLSTEPWRILTFQFFHLNLMHLVENIIGFVLVVILAVELEIDFKSFLTAYFLSIFVIVVVTMILFPDVSVAGNSTGIYGILALSLVKGRKLISEKIAIPLVVIFIFSLSILNFVSCGTCYEKFFKSDFFHFIGLLTGLSVSLIPKPRAKRILRI